MSRHESPEVGAAIGRLLNGLIRRASEGDWEALEALANIERQAPAAMTAALIASREHYSLGVLGSVVRTSRQAVGQRTANESWKAWTPLLASLDGRCGHPTCLGMAKCREKGLVE